MGGSFESLLPVVVVVVLEEVDDWDRATPIIVGGSLDSGIVL